MLQLKKPVLSSLALAPLIATAGDGGVSPKAYQLTEVFGLPITNSMVTTFVLAIIIVVTVRLMAGKMSLIPSKGQSMIEGLIEWIQGLIEPIVGKHMVKPTFPLLAGLFVFILINNWSGLFPGVGTFGTLEADLHHPLTTQEEVQEYKEEGGKVMEVNGETYAAHLIYYFRPANSDLNTTTALAMVSMVFWLYFVMRYAGPKMLMYDIFGNKADKADTPMPLYYLLFVIFFAVGLIEVVSILFRPVSLSFRLYGNIFGGENLLQSMHSLFLWLLPIPFYFLELLIGFVQALVFTLLVSVYIGLICNHEGEEHGAEHAH